MKKILLLVALVYSFAAIAQEKLTQGVIISKMTTATDNVEMNKQLSKADMINTIYFKDSKSRTETISPLTGDIVVIIDKEAKTMLSLVDIPMQGKLYKKETIEEPNKDADNTSITKGETTKSILGFECAQYLISTNVEGQVLEMEILATNEIDIYSQETKEFANSIDGYPLYIKIKTSQMTEDMSILNMIIVVEVTEIRKEEVPDDKFDLTIPAGYEEMRN